MDTQFDSNKRTIVDEENIVNELVATYPNDFDLGAALRAIGLPKDKVKELPGDYHLGSTVRNGSPSCSL